MSQLLIIEDDTHINQLLKQALEKDGYICTQAFSGTEGRLLLQNQTFDLILLDLMLPGMSGEQLLQDIRTAIPTPVIVLTAKDNLDDKIDMLKNGADDYITKPFEIKEVLARIEVQLRRAGREPGTPTLTWKDMVLDQQSRQITIQGVPLSSITKQEFAILELLLRNPRQVFSKEEIFEYAWKEVYLGETKTLDVHISHIRKKNQSGHREVSLTSEELETYFLNLTGGDAQ